MMEIEKLDEKEIKFIKGTTLENKIGLGLIIFLLFAILGISLTYMWGINFINLQTYETPKISKEDFRGIVYCVFILSILLLVNSAWFLFTHIRMNKKFKGIIDKLLKQGSSEDV